MMAELDKFGVCGWCRDRMGWWNGGTCTSDPHGTRCDCGKFLPDNATKERLRQQLERDRNPCQHPRSEAHYAKDTPGKGMFHWCPDCGALMAGEAVWRLPRGVK